MFRLRLYPNRVHTYLLLPGLLLLFNVIPPAVTLTPDSGVLTLLCPPDLEIDPESAPLCLEFEEFDAGDLVDSVSTPWGPVLVNATSKRYPDGNAAMIFDSGNPTGGDTDLGSPNEDFGGPGVGKGGKANTPYRLDKEQGNVLIISKDLDSNDPNDDERGGEIEFDFSEIEDGVTLHSMEFVDMEKTAVITIYGLDGTVMKSVLVPVSGNNGFITADLEGAENVSRVVVTMSESSSIDKFCFSKGVPLGFGKAETTCRGDVTVSFTDEIIPGECPGNYTILRTYRALDECGNESICTQTIKVGSDTPPTILNCPAEPLDLGCNPDSLPSLLELDIDAYPGANIDISVDTDTTILGCDYTVDRTYIATDECGKADTCIEQFFFTIDTLFPKILACPADTVVCEDDPLIDNPRFDEVIAEDNCSDEVFKEASDVLDTLDNGDIVIARTFTLSDECNNQVRSTHFITVKKDSICEVEDCPTEIEFINLGLLDSIPTTVSCIDELPAQPDLLFINSNGDTVAAKKEVEFVPDSCGGFATFSWSAMDTTCAGGNELSEVFFVEVLPVLPQLAIPANDTVSCDSLAATTISYSNGEDGVCAISGTITSTLEVTQGTDECPLEFMETWTLIICEDTITGSRIRTIGESPIVVSCPDTLILSEFDTIPGEEESGIEVSGGCGQNLITLVDTREDSIASSPNGPVIQITRTYTIENSCSGFIDTCERIIQIFPESNFAKVFRAKSVPVCNPDSIPAPVENEDIPAEFGITIIDVTEILNNLEDCQIELQREYQVARNGLPDTSVLRTFIWTVDTIAPEIVNCPADVTFSGDIPAFDPDSVLITDGCSEPMLMVTDSIVEDANCGLFQVIRTFTAVDACGNQSSCQQTLSRIDSGFVCQVPADTIEACPGSEVFLNPGAENESCLYEWTSNLPLSDPNAPNPSFTMPDSGSVQISVRISTPDGNCSIDKVVTIISDSQVGLELPQIQVNTCGEPVTLMAFTDLPAEFIWSDEPDFESLLGIEDSITVSPAQTTRFYVRAEANNCTETGIVDVQVNTIDANVPDVMVCDLSDLIELNVSNNAPVQELQFDWLDDSLLIGNDGGASAQFQLESPQPLQVLVSNQFSCTDTLSGSVNLMGLGSPIEASVSRDTIFAGQTTELSVTGCDDCLFSWTPDATLENGRSSTTEASPMNTTLFTVTTAKDECSYTDTVRVVVIELCEGENIFVPNTFTPGVSQGTNDYFRPRSQILDNNLVTTFEFFVYNRWGQEIFYSNDPEGQGWDGTFKGEMMEPGVFGFYLEFQCPGGDIIRQKGNVTLIR